MNWHIFLSPPPPCQGTFFSSSKKKTVMDGLDGQETNGDSFKGERLWDVAREAIDTGINKQGGHGCLIGGDNQVDDTMTADNNETNNIVPVEKYQVQSTSKNYPTCIQNDDSFEQILLLDSKQLETQQIESKKTTNEKKDHLLHGQHHFYRRLEDEGFDGWHDERETGNHRTDHQELNNIGGATTCNSINAANLHNNTALISHEQQQSHLALQSNLTPTPILPTHSPYDRPLQLNDSSSTNKSAFPNIQQNNNDRMQALRVTSQNDKKNKNQTYQGNYLIFPPTQYQNSHIWKQNACETEHHSSVLTPQSQGRLLPLQQPFLSPKQWTSLLMELRQLSKQQLRASKQILKRLSLVEQTNSNNNGISVKKATFTTKSQQLLHKSVSRGHKGSVYNPNSSSNRPKYETIEPSSISQNCHNLSIQSRDNAKAAYGCLKTPVRKGAFQTGKKQRSTVGKENYHKDGNCGSIVINHRNSWNQNETVKRKLNEKNTLSHKANCKNNNNLTQSKNNKTSKNIQNYPRIKDDNSQNTSHFLQSKISLKPSQTSCLMNAKSNNVRSKQSQISNKFTNQRLKQANYSILAYKQPLFDQLSITNHHCSLADQESNIVAYNPTQLIFETLNSEKDMPKKMRQRAVSHNV